MTDHTNTNPPGPLEAPSSPSPADAGGAVEVAVPPAVEDIVTALRAEADDDQWHPGTTIDLLQEAAEEIERLRAVLRPFAEAWQAATHHKEIVSKLTMAQLGKLAAHEVSGVHFHNAYHLLNKEGK